MAIDQGTETLAITTQERTWRVTIETPKGADPTVTVHREIVRSLPDGTVIAKEPCGQVSRSLSATALQSYKVGGKSYATAEIAGVIAAIADTWREEDIAAEAARAEAFRKAQEEQVNG